MRILRSPCSLAALGALALLLPLHPASAAMGPVSSSQLQSSPDIIAVAKKKRGGGAAGMQQMQMIQQMLPPEFQGYLQGGSAAGGRNGEATNGTGGMNGGGGLNGAGGSNGIGNLGGGLPGGLR